MTSTVITHRNEIKTFFQKNKTFYLAGKHRTNQEAGPMNSALQRGGEFADLRG